MPINIISKEYSRKHEQQKQLSEWHEEGIRLRNTDPKTAVELADKITAYSIESGHSKYQVLGTILKATCLSALGKNDEALTTLDNAQRLHRQYLPQDKKHLLDILNCKGIIYSHQGNYQLAINALLSCLPLGKDSELSKPYSNLGAAYSSIGNEPKAIEYLRKAQKIAKENNELKVFIACSYNIIFSIAEMGKTSEAKEDTYKLLSFLEQYPEKQEGFLYYKTMTINFLGELYREEQNYTLALEMQEQALIDAKKMSRSQLCCSILNSMAYSYFGQKDEKNALIKIHESLRYADESGFMNKKRHTLETVIKFYKDNNEATKAFPFLEMLYELSQEQLTQSRDKNLQKIITEREQEIHLLEEKNKEIEEQNAILKQFAYIISHDLREPIRGITGFANMLNNKYAQNLDKTGNEYLKFILSEAHSMNRNLARLLQYTTIEKNTDNHKEIDLQRIINDIRLQHQDKSFRLNISFEGVPIKMQRQHAILLLNELTDNAIQFRKEGEDCQIEIKCELKEGGYHLSVKDYGIGIDPAYHHKIFKIFNKINKWEGTGAGVGLAICERIVQLYKGEISVESTPNLSTTFHIKIAM